ncbi:MAG TPA: hypothetical protein VFS43_38385 [Polyangiaceae bacterium]|nr:hypothetical protein [Polyangiaceae bacterium]
MFVRRFQRRPPVATLRAVSGVVIVDEPPPVAANAAPFGNVCCVGEFEDGPFHQVTPILSSRDFPRLFGGLGHDYGGKRYQHACAVRSGGTEPFNGSGYVQLARLPFGKLSICRVDTSIGQVALTPLAYVQASGKLAPYALSAGQTLSWERDGVSRTATFAATAAVKDGAGGTFTSFTGGEQIQIELNDQPAVTVTFLAGDDTQPEIISRINAAFGFALASNNAGQLRLTSNQLGTGSAVRVLTSAAATTLGLNNTRASGTGDAANIAAATFAEVAAKVTATDAGSAARQGPDGLLRLVSLTAGAGTVRVLAGTANAALGLADQTGGAVTTAALRADVVIPAGTRVRGAGGDATRVVTMQTTSAARGSTATVPLKVRPALDDGTYAGLASGQATTLEDKPGGEEWAASNPQALSAALTAAQLDSAYLAAISATLGTSDDRTKKLNGIVSARQSNAIRGAVVSNAVSASANGHYDRRAFVCPPNGTSAAAALQAAAPGVGAYRDEAVSYVPGGVRCFLQELVDGGYVTEAAPEIVRHPDALYASRYSTLGPGLNPAQFPEDPALRFDATTFPGLEPAAASWDVITYAAFKAAGVTAALFTNATGVVFGDGVTSVDPLQDPSRVNVARRSLAGFIGDTCAELALVQVKRQATQRRVDNTRTAIEGFLDTLVEPRGEVLSSYDVQANPGDAPGITEFTIAASQVSSADTILFNLKVGPNAVDLARG